VLSQDAGRCTAAGGTIAAALDRELKPKLPADNANDEPRLRSQASVAHIRRSAPAQRAIAWRQQHKRKIAAMRA
jgi:hypothetical protein